MSTLFMVNVPHNCTGDELSEWVQSSGIGVKQVRLIRDLVAGVSPSFAYVEIEEKIPVADAVQKLNGSSIRERKIIVCEARKGVGTVCDVSARPLGRRETIRGEGNAL